MGQTPTRDENSPQGGAYLWILDSSLPLSSAWSCPTAAVTDPEPLTSHLAGSKCFYYTQGNLSSSSSICLGLFYFHRTDINYFLSFQFRSVAQSCPTLCNPMNRSTPGLPVHHQLLEFTQTQAHRVSEAIQPSHPLSSHSVCQQIWKTQQ